MRISHYTSIFILTLWILILGAAAERKTTSDCLCGLKEEDGIKWTVQLKVTGNSETSVGTVIASNAVLASEKFLTYIEIKKVPEIIMEFDKEKNMTVEVEITHTFYVPTLRKVGDIEATSTDANGKKTVYQVSGIYNWTGATGTWSEMVVLRMGSPYFTVKDSKIKPACFPTPEELSTVGTRAGGTVVFRSASWGDVSGYVKEDCGAGGGLPTSEGKLLCITLGSYASGQVRTNEEGQPLFAEVARNPHAKDSHGSFWYLVGITVAVRESGGVKHVYFATVKPESISAVEKYVPGDATWCQRPWAWATDPTGRRDESLNCECGIPNPSNTTMTEFEFPWMAKIEYSGDRAPCGGAIISNKVILTAAHCFVQKTQILATKRSYNVLSQKGQPDAPTYKVFLHSHRASKDPKEMLVVHEKILIHPGFIDGRRITPWRNLEHDIALVILKTPLTFPTPGTEMANVMPICLPKTGERIEVVGMSATVAGWGATSLDLTFPEELRKQSFNITSFSECTNAFPTAGTTLTFNTVFCGGMSSVTRHPPITGDLGGPVFVKASKGRLTQVGLVGYSLTRPNDDFTGKISAAFYQDLQALLPWVDYHSKKEGAKYCKN